MNTTQPIARAWGRTRQTVARRLFLDRQAAFWVGELAPLRSHEGLRAEVLRVVQETEDAKTFVLRPSAAWRGHLAGQYVSVEIEVDGVRAHRCYSISSAPGEAAFTITVKRLPGGRVSSWLHDQVGVGDLVGIGPAVGDFVLPATPSPKLLFLSGGSGITPVMSMLRDLAGKNSIEDVVFVHYARRTEAVIFREELQALAARYSGLRLLLCLDDDPATPAGFDEAHFADLVPDFATRDAFLCGPQPLMDRAEELWKGTGASDRLRREQFAPTPATATMNGGAEGVHLRLIRSERELVARGGGTLLERLERAGERPQHACRIGICHTCTCRKRSGVVRNALTGQLSSEPDEAIQLCISIPESDLELEL